MSGNVKTINSSSQSNTLYEEWHKEHHKTIHHHGSHFNGKGIEHVALLIGAPNVGKSTFFNKITSSTAIVSNIDRMTVEDTIGRLRTLKSIAIVDLPGLYNLSHPLDEEKVVAHEIFGEHFHKIINIVGSESIKRDLLLTLQCLETGMVSTLIVNMIDEIHTDAIDFKKLSKLLGNVKVIPTQANRRIGLSTADNSIKNDHNVSSLHIKYSTAVESHVAKLIKVLPNRNISTRFYALMLLENNQYIKDELEHHYPSHWEKIKPLLNNVNFYKDIVATKEQYINNILNQCISKTKPYIKSTKFTQHKVDHFLLNKWIGIPLFFLMMILIYFISFSPWTGGALQTLLAGGTINYVHGSWSTDGLSGLILNNLHKTIGTNAIGLWVGNFFFDGVIQGFFAVLSFIPVIFILFILVNIMNQVGIISRTSVLLDQALAKFGISGRSVVGLLTGFGCSVPAVMMSRSSNSTKERIVAILITPFVACSARVIVFSFVCNLISPTWGWAIMITLVLLSGLIALCMGLIFSKILFRQQKSFFLVEMVNWRKPDFVVIMKSVWLQLKEFIKKAGLIIVSISAVIWLLLHICPNYGFNNWYKAGDDILDPSGHILTSSLLGYVSRGLQYIFVPIGFGNIGSGSLSNDGWKLTASILTAVPAKEIAITNINMLYGVGNFHLPTPEVLSYLMMIMLMMPCAATLAIIKKEGGWKTLGIQMAGSFIVAYLLAIVVYWVAFGLSTVL